MEVSRLLDNFFSLANTDARISVTHISVFTAILQSAGQRDSHSLSMFSYQLMELAKISCGKTYFRVIRELSEFGYLRYEPSYHKNRPSKIHLIDTNSSLFG